MRITTLKLVQLCAAASLTSLFPWSVDAATITLQAEKGTIAAPMKIITDPQTGKPVVETHVTDLTGKTSGSVKLKFNVKQAGTYNISASVKSFSPEHDSLFVQVDAKAITAKHFTKHDEYSLYTLGSAKLSRGTHTITVYGREQYTRLDYIQVSTTAPVVTKPQEPPAAPLIMGQACPAFDESLLRLSGSGRGFFRQFGVQAIPLETAPSPEDASWRLDWRALEPTRGNYNTSRIDTLLASLPAGSRLSFSVIGMNQNAPASSLKIRYSSPDYIVSSNKKSILVPLQDGTSVHMPDWNDAFYIERYKALIAFLASKYDGDPRINVVDIRTHGNWGEGHVFVSGFGDMRTHYKDAKLNPGGAVEATMATKLELASAYKAFKKTQLISMSDDVPVMLSNLAFATSKPVGLRRDSFGSKQFDTTFNTLTDAQKEIINNRWKIAPFIVEAAPPIFGVGEGELDTYVKKYHISAINGQAYNPWNNLTSAEKQGLKDAGYAAGYTYGVGCIDFPTQIPAKTTSFATKTKWVNFGSAPVYEDLVVTYKLVAPGSSTVARTWTSSANLRQVLDSAEAKEFTETVDLGSALPVGTYDLYVTVTFADTALPRDPLWLPHGARGQDGSYYLTTTTVK